ncbi:E3 ubiquitin-protein ligase RNF165-like [Triticum aestivum]|uniref:E3 ubiquitin-protein ligase RNF165-like n=1 Tax=Triticum aestivum TaxID=4565 RepID=UPI001D021817|nr:E3 ubiquitin-protein ligase RNF165-like [Triticum aestivum]
MGLMAGMLPGIEFARRRRLRPAAEAACAGARRPASLGVFWHDHAHLGSAGFAMQRSGLCEEAWATQLDSIAREAKERLDHKLRSRRESVVKRGPMILGGPVRSHSSHTLLDGPAYTLPSPRRRQKATPVMSCVRGARRPRRTCVVAQRLRWRGVARRREGQDSGHVGSAALIASEHRLAGATAREASGSLQREVFTKKCGGRRFSWGRRKEQQQQAECAVCLEEFRGGDVLAHLPCAHRFHWARAVPWVQAASRCPFCRAAVHLADHQLV